MSDVIDPEKLKAARAARNLNPSQLALEAGLARNVVHRLEDGSRGKSVRLETVARLAEVLGVTVDDLMLDEIPEDPPATTPRERATASTAPEPNPEAWRWG